MAHHSAGATGGSGGIESLTAKVGPGTAFMGLGLFFAGIWLAVKYPRSFGRAVCIGVVVTLVLFAGGITDANPMQHPFISLLVIGLGFTCAPDKSQDKKGARK
jgi:hypothetical protein